MAKASISRAWEESRSLFVANSRVLSAVALALIVFPATVLGTISPKAAGGAMVSDKTTAILFLAVTIISVIARLTITRVALGSRETLSTAIGRGARRSPVVIGAFLLFMVPVAFLISPFVGPVVKSPQQPPPGAILGLTGIMLLALVFGTRLLTMVMPAAMVEGRGSFALLKRSWTLTRGNWLRLIGFVFVFYLGSAIASQAVMFVFGGILILVTGPVEPLSISALILAIMLAIVTAIFVTIFSVMVARIYVQLAGTDHAATSVPSTAD